MAAASWKGILALLACAHCSLTFFVALGALAFAGATPTLLGVRADLILVPAAIGALFAGWLWWGRRASADACALPSPDR